VYSFNRSLSIFGFSLLDLLGPSYFLYCNYYIRIETSYVSVSMNYADSLAFGFCFRLIKIGIFVG